MPVLDLPNPEGWKAELTLVLVIYRDGLPVRSHRSKQQLLDNDKRPSRVGS